VAIGYSQQEGLDYGDTFFLVLKLSSMHILLAFATYYYLHAHQMDIIMAYLNAKLKEDIFMELLEGFVPPPSISLTKQLVCTLHKALYGLKQSR